MGSEVSRERKQNYMLTQFREAYKLGKLIDLDKFISSFCIEMLCTERTAREMLNIFIKNKRVVLHKNRIEVLK